MMFYHQKYLWSVPSIYFYAPFKMFSLHQDHNLPIFWWENEKYLVTWNIWDSRIIYFRLHKSRLRCFGHWHKLEIYNGNFGIGYQCGPCKRDTRGIGEVSIHDGGKVPGYAGRPWSHAARGTRVNTVTIGNYHKKTFLRDIKRGHQVSGW